MKYCFPSEAQVDLDTNSGIEWFSMLFRPKLPYFSIKKNIELAISIFVPAFIFFILNHQTLLRT